MAYERKQYAVAIELLEAEYANLKNEAQKARKAYLAGQSYMKLLDYQEAINWFEKAVKLDYGPEALGKLAEAMIRTENYSGAINIFQRLKSASGNKQELDRSILLCKQALDAKNLKSNYHIERLPESSEVSDFSPVLYENEFLVFTSERQEASGKDIYKWTGEHFSDIFIIQKGGSEVKRFDSAINTNQNEGNAWFSKDMETMYFTRCFSTGAGDDYCKIMVSKRQNEVWSEPEVLPFTRDKINYGQATLIENDSVLVFSADIAEPGGNLDLYYVVLDENGVWSEPETLPSAINSQGNEMFPTGDKDTLYFSSDYLPGFGGFDIFKTYLKADRSWSIPLNVGYGINSGGDEFSFIVDRTVINKPGILMQGFFTSSRFGSGKDDIFRFQMLKPEPEKQPETEVKPTEKELFITVKVFTPTFNTAEDPNSGISGQLPLPETFIKIVDENEKKIAESYTDGNGFYFSAIPLNKQIKVIGAKLGYLNASAMVDTKNLSFSEGETIKTINVELVLDKIYTDKEIHLRNIYYDYDKWDIKKEAEPALNELVKILTDNPQINIQLSSHTDCRGDDMYNLELSQKRAQAAVDYLIAKGVAPSRLIATGYGESQLIDLCACEKCTESQHQLNRRTTFKILKR